MKKLLVVFLTLSLISSAFAQAAETNQTQSGEEIVVLEEEPSIIDEIPEESFLPDNPLYNFKLFGEAVQNFLTFEPERKAELQIKIAEKRLSESAGLARKHLRQKDLNDDGVIDENDFEIIDDIISGKIENPVILEEGVSSVIERTMQRYSSIVGATSVETLNNEQLLEDVSGKTFRHIEVLTTLQGLVPEQARNGIENAINSSFQGHERSMESISRINITRSAELESVFLDKQFEKMKRMAERNSSEELVNNFAQVYENKMRNMERAIQRLNDSGFNPELFEDKFIEKSFNQSTELAALEKKFKNFEEFKNIKESVKEKYENKFSEMIERRPERAFEINRRIINAGAELARKEMEFGDENFRAEFMEEFSEDFNKKFETFNEFQAKFEEKGLEFGEFSGEAAETSFNARARFLEFAPLIPSQAGERINEIVQKASESNNQFYQQVFDKDPQKAFEIGEKFLKENTRIMENINAKGGLNVERVNTIMEDYNNFANKMSEISTERPEFQERFASNTFEHYNKFGEFIQAAPEDARKNLEAGIVQVSKFQKNAVEQIGRVDPAKAAELNFEFAEKQLGFIEQASKQGRAPQAFLEFMTGQYQEKFEESSNFAEKARESGGEERFNQFNERLSQISGEHAKKLEEVYQFVPEEARGAIGKAIEAPQQGFQRAIEHIQAFDPTKAEQFNEQFRFEVPQEFEEAKREFEARSPEGFVQEFGTGAQQGFLAPNAPQPIEGGQFPQQGEGFIAEGGFAEPQFKEGEGFIGGSATQPTGTESIPGTSTGTFPEGTQPISGTEAFTQPTGTETKDGEFATQPQPTGTEPIAGTTFPTGTEPTGTTSPESFTQPTGTEPQPTSSPETFTQPSEPISSPSEPAPAPAPSEPAPAPSEPYSPPPTGGFLRISGIISWLKSLFG